MVFGHRFVLVAALVLLVDHDDAKIFKGGEQSAPGADDHVDLAAAGALPLVRLLALGQGRIHHRHPLAKIAIEPKQRLIGQGDLGDQHDGLLPALADASDD